MEKDTALIDILLSAVKSEDSLPPLSQNSLLLQREIAKTSPEIRKIEAMIKYDPALTGHLLKIANSVLYKGLVKIGTVKDAILRLGINEIKNIVSWSIHRANFQTKDPFIRAYKTRLWSHSLSCAMGSVWTAKYLDLEADKIVSKAFIAGLLHDMGTLCLLFALEKAKSDKKIDAYPSQYLLQEMMDKFHPEMGYNLLKHWNLPEEYYIVARDHHAEEFDQSNQLLILVRLVNMICNKMENGSSKQDMATIISSTEASLLGVSEIGIAEIEIEIEVFQKKFSAHFGAKAK
jgi:HD-like signal output (HDOD) protein